MWNGGPCLTARPLPPLGSPPPPVLSPVGTRPDSGSRGCPGGPGRTAPLSGEAGPRPPRAPGPCALQQGPRSGSCRAVQGPQEGPRRQAVRDARPRADPKVWILPSRPPAGLGASPSAHPDGSTPLSFSPCPLARGSTPGELQKLLCKMLQSWISQTQLDGAVGWGSGGRQAEEPPDLVRSSLGACRVGDPRW